MFRVTNTLRVLSLSNSNLPQSNTNMQTLRFKRKPMWMPTAKSKVFRVPRRPEVSQEEEDEVKRLFNNYRTQIKSLRRYLTYQHATRFQQNIDTELHSKEFEEDFSRCMKLNEEWNASVKVQREERYRRELEEDLEKAKRTLEEKKQRDAARLEEVEEIVRREKKAAVNFITRENLDEAIEKAIANPVDYNYAIDLEGNKIVGRETNVVESQPKEEISVKQ